MQFVYAQTTNLEGRELLLQKIEQLLTEVANLQARLAQQLSGTVLGTAYTDEKNGELYQTRFYIGEYEAIYKIPNITLIPVLSETVRTGDLLLWNRYADLVGTDFIKKYIAEFRIYNDRETEYDAFIEQKPNGYWVLGVNRLGDDFTKTYTSPFIMELLLHESAHIPFFLNDTYQEEFTNTFWSTKTMRAYSKKLAAISDVETRTEFTEAFYEDHMSYFVSQYSVESPSEDIAESFVAFVTEPYPTKTNTRDKKIKFFYSYPELTAWRTALRNSGVLTLQ